MLLAAASLASASKEDQNGNKLVYSALLTHLHSVLKSDWPPIYWVLTQKQCSVLLNPFRRTCGKMGDGSGFETREISETG